MLDNFEPRTYDVHQRIDELKEKSTDLFCYVLISVVLELRFKLGPPTLGMISDIQALARKIVKLDSTLPESRLKELRLFEDALDLDQFGISRLFCVTRQQEQELAENIEPSGEQFLTPNRWSLLPRRARIASAPVDFLRSASAENTSMISAPELNVIAPTQTNTLSKTLSTPVQLLSTKPARSYSQLNSRLAAAVTMYVQ